MAKRRQRPTSVKASITARHAGGEPTPVQPVAPDNDSPPAPQPPQHRSSYVEAVALYEQAIRTLQQHHYSKAADLLRHVLTRFPEERELLDRARLYVGLCERQLEPPTAEPRNTRERLYAATLALNAGQLDQAIDYLDRVVSEEVSNDQALYMLAVAHSGRGDPSVAIPYLQRAIEANAENRALARLDPDLEALRDEDAVMALLDQAAGPRRQAPARRQAPGHRRQGSVSRQQARDPRR